VIGLDTNVVVRYIMQDDPRQARPATELIESLTADAPGFVTLVSMAEIAWVLASAYGLTRIQVCQALEGLLRTQEILVERAEVVWRALRLFQSGGADFADGLIAHCSAAAGCERTMTFDRAAAKAGGMTLLA